MTAHLAHIFADEFVAALAGWVAVIATAGFCILGFNIIIGKRP